MEKKRIITSVVLVIALVCSAALVAFGEISIETSSKINSDGSYTLIAAATDDEDGDLTYQWYRCNSTGAIISAVSGATGNVCQPEPEEDDTYYLCRVTSTTLFGEETSRDSSVFTVEGAPKEVKNVEIMTFAIEGIDKPISGMSPDTTAIATGSAASGYSITAVSWEPRTSTYQPETAYTVTITVKLAEGYVAGNGYRCTINGETAVSNGNTTGDTVEFYYTFPKTEAAADTAPAAEPEKESAAPLGIPGFVWLLIILAIIAVIIVLIVKSVKNKKARAAAYGRKNRYRDEEDPYTARIREAEEAEKDLNELKRIRAIDRENIQNGRGAADGLAGGAVYGAEMTEQDAIHRRKMRETVHEPMDINGTNANPETSGFRDGSQTAPETEHRMAGTRVPSSKETIVMSKSAIGKQASSDTINMKKSDIEEEQVKRAQKSNRPFRKKPEEVRDDNDNDISYFDDSEVDNKYF